MRAFNTYAGLSYNIFHVSGAEDLRRRETREKIARYSAIESLYAGGVRDFNEGELARAKAGFKSILEMKADHMEARSYMEKIIETEDNYLRASELAEKKNYFAAIPFLARAEKHMKEARKDLADIRSRLAPLVPDMERRGVGAYDRNDYETCIDLMNKVQLIDPSNRTARIYLPRAIRRDEALKKLK